MSEQPQRVRLDQVDWRDLLPWTCMFRSFRMAISPQKIALGAALVVLTVVFSRVIDWAGGQVVYPQEIRATASMDKAAYDAWRGLRENDTKVTLRRHLDHMPTEQVNAVVESEDRFTRAREELRGRADDKQLDNVELRRKLASLEQVEPQGVFEAVFEFKTQAFYRLVRAAAALRFGFDDVDQAAGGISGGRGDTVIGSMRDLFVTLPNWLRRTHPIYLTVYLLGFSALCAVFGGAICRLAALDASGAVQVSTTSSVRFALSRFAWFFLSPLFPSVLAFLLIVLLLVGGLVFNVMVLDVLGGLLFAVFLVIGVAAAMLLVLMATGGHLLYPAVAVEDADMFDAVSRALGYVLARPWRWLFLSVVALVYGALTYLFLMLVVSLALAITQWGIGAGVVTDLNDMDRFDAIMPKRSWGDLMRDPHHDLPVPSKDYSAKGAAMLIWLWTGLLVSALWAYVVSYYFTANTWIYLLLRRSVDGNGLDDVYQEPTGSTPSAKAEGGSTPTAGEGA